MKSTNRLIWSLLVVFGFFQFASAQSVSKALLKQDLTYIVETVSDVHPALVEAEMQQALTARAASLVRALPDEVPRWRVGVTVAELLRVLDDAHTTTDMTFGSSRYLPLQFAWLSDGLVVAPVTGSKVAIPVASEVLKIGELGTKALERRLSRLASENRYWVRETGARNLPAESVLRWLEVVENDAVKLVVRTPSGETKIAKVKLTSYGLGASQDLQERLLEAKGLSGDWRVVNDVVAWRVDKSEDYGLFWLRHCVDTAEYRAEVGRFFQEVADSSVANVIVSVQQNGGGTNSVIDPFMSYLPERPYTIYSGKKQRYSQLAETRFGFSRQLLARDSAHQHGSLYISTFPKEIAERSSPTFQRSVITFIDTATFSSAADLATVLSDYHFATLVGEATGGVPTTYGNPVENLLTPNLDVSFGVSTTLWKRPDPTRDPADTLAPDIPLPVTVKDVQTGHSPITAWLEQLATNAE